MKMSIMTKTMMTGIFDHGGLILSEYSQQDAEFTGYEIQIGTRFELPRGQLVLTLGRDEVNAEFTRGGDVPRNRASEKPIFSTLYVG